MRICVADDLSGQGQRPTEVDTYGCRVGGKCLVISLYHTGQFDGNLALPYISDTGKGIEEVGRTVVESTSSLRIVVGEISGFCRISE